MKTGTALVTSLLALASFPLLAQQPSAAGQPNSPAAQQNPPATEQASPNSPTASAEAPAVAMSPVNAELTSKLDSKTAKTGDKVVVQTKESVKTASGTEIPTGSKLVGRVVGVQASESGANSQVALQFDHIELKSGQSLPIHSQIQSITPASGSASAGSGTMSGPRAGAAANPNASGASSAQQAGDSSAGAGTRNPPPGIVVAKNGNIAISTTSVPGVLLANNAPGQQDPRMAEVSSILLGAKQDVELDGGTQMVIGVSAEGGGTR